MPIRIFISYSHKDDSYREDLENYLSLMKRHGEVSTWTDRKITGGSDWKNEIHSALEEADLVICLVSQDFISSDYCFDIEMKRAMERHSEKSCMVLPVLVRVADWSRSDLGRLQSLPREAKPISKWNDKDEAWIDVVEGIREAIRSLPPKVKSLEQLKSSIELSTSQINWLNDTEVQLSHRRATKVDLLDIYVPPDLKRLNIENIKVSQTTTPQKIANSNKSCIIYGDEQSGKTSLAKYLFSEIFKAGLTPIVLKGQEINRAEIDALLSKKYREQFEDGLDHTKIPIDRKVAIIDDFSTIKLNKKFTSELIKNLTENFKKIILISHESYRYIALEIDEITDFNSYTILGFGNLKRQELIERWVSLGVEQQISDQDLYKDCDEIKTRLDAIVRNNVVPAKPFFLLSLLQTLEAYTPQKFDLTSHGHCYQYLVYQALEKANIKPVEIDKYLNVLTELAWAQYRNNNKKLNSEQVTDFFDEYESRYLKVDREKVISDLTKTKLLTNSNNLIEFKYPYIYYFFAAKKLSDSISGNEESRKELQKLLINLHREENANIIIFVTHHTKDKWVLDEIQISLMELFEDHTEAALDVESLDFIEKFIREIPELVIEQRSVAEERKATYQRMDEASESEQAAQDATNSMEPSDLLAKVNRVFKGIEIVGQVIRNRHASLSRDSMLELASQAYSTGLRFMHFFLKLSDIAKEEVVRMIAHTLKENPTINQLDLEKEARNVFIYLTYASIFGLIKKISSSTGSAEAEEIYELIEINNSTPAVILINQSTTLQFQKRINFQKLEEISEKLRKNPVCERILKEILIQHIYMFPVDYKERQKISTTLNIPLEGLQQIELKREFRA